MWEGALLRVSKIRRWVHGCLCILILKSYAYFFIFFIFNFIAVTLVGTMHILQILF